MERVELLPTAAGEVPKSDHPAGTWRPTLTPRPPATLPSFFEARIFPRAGVPVTDTRSWT